MAAKNSTLGLLLSSLVQNTWQFEIGVDKLVVKLPQGLTALLIIQICHSLGNLVMVAIFFLCHSVKKVVIFKFFTMLSAQSHD